MVPRPRLVAALIAATGANAAAAPARPAPLASIAEDIDGDGSPDAIELGGDGVVHIAGTPRGEVKIAATVAQARLAVSHYRGKYYVVAQMTATPATPAAPAAPAASEAVILGVAGGVWHEVLRFALGGVGLDHDYGVAVDATPDGIYRYQTRGDIRRCDGVPAYLFAEKFDGTRFRPASALPSRVPDSAAVVPAVLDPAPGRVPLLYQAHAASLQIGAGDAGGLLIPRELDDGRLDTLWREELAASTGEGQFFTFEARSADLPAVQLRIVPGDPASSATMRSFNRPRRLAIVSAHDAWRTELPDAAGEPLGAAFVVDLPRPVTGCVTVVLESTYGPAQGTTAIAELEVFAEGERTGSGEALLAHVVAEGASGATAAASALGKRGPSAVAAIESELAATSDPAARGRLVGALARVGDPAAAPALGRAATAGWVRGQDLLDVIAALGALGQRPVLRDLAATRTLPVAARERAIAQLPAAGPGLALLVELDGQLVAEETAERAARPAPASHAIAATGRLTRPDDEAPAPGSGPRQLRRAAIAQLSAAPVAELLAAAAHETAPAVAGDVWRAMTVGARTAAANRAPVLAAMLAALPAAIEYERQYRLVDGIATLGGGDELRALAERLGALPPTAETAALRQVAIRAIASHPRPGGVELLLASAADRDPGVRMAALGALAGPGSAEAEPTAIDREIDRALGGALAHDRWPEVRRRAASALGGRCQRPEPARALTEAVDHGAELAVRGEALNALVQCHAPGAAALLARLWDDGNAPLELRSQAVLGAAALGDPALGAALIARLARWRGEAVQSPAALALAQVAAASIGRLAPPGAAGALRQALDDAAFPEIVQAAALGLGALGPACPASAKARLVELARSDEPSAVAAKRAAAQCGR
jgi:hypothetical protein